MRIIDISGNKYSRLTVINREKSTNGRSKWLCKCDCGKTIIAQAANLKNGNTQSCGCQKAEKLSKMRKSHGESRSKLYQVWLAMIKRCKNLHNEHTKKNYFERNITVCPEWVDYLAFKKWAINNGYKENLTIDRIDNENGYSPENCRWVDYKVQNNNTRRNHVLTFNGVSKTLSQWSEVCGIKAATIAYRLKLGWDIEDVLYKEVNAKYRNSLAEVV